MKALLVFFFVMVPSAFAAQDSTIIADNAPIRVDPRSNGKVIEYVPIGTEVRVSSYPMPGGWYKVRAKNGVYGWMHEKFLSVYKPEQDALGQPKKPQDAGPRPERDRKFYLRGFGGFDFFRPEDINALFEFRDLNTGYNLGGEVGYFLSERMSVSLRTEALVKDIVAKENQSGIPFNLALRSYPVMGGLDFYVLKMSAARLSLGIFGGIALATSFASEATSLAQPNIMVMQRSPFTSYARANLTRPLGRIISVFIELGYRYLRTEEIDTSSSSFIQGGPQIYAKEGFYRPRVIDLSGVVLDIGLGVHF